jgi:hypothetical protein
LTDATVLTISARIPTMAVIRDIDASPMLGRNP